MIRYAKTMNAREKILNYIKEKGHPASSKELSENLGLSKNTVYYNTTILVAAEKIERYRGLAGVFVLVKMLKCPFCGEELQELKSPTPSGHTHQCPNCDSLHAPYGLKEASV